MSWPRSLPLKGSVHTRNSELHKCPAPKPMKNKGDPEHELLPPPRSSGYKRDLLYQRMLGFAKNVSTKPTTYPHRGSLNFFIHLPRSSMSSHRPISFRLPASPCVQTKVTHLPIPTFLSSLYRQYFRYFFGGGLYAWLDFRYNLQPRYYQQA